MTVNVGGIISIVIFYLIILLVGIWASRKRSNGKASETEEVMLAGRNIGIFVGIFTMTATWVGGGYINGTAEIIFSRGIIWCQAPFGYALSLVIGGTFFANQMRKEGYVTMLDPFQECYGKTMGGILFLPALIGDVFWTAGILSALGATVSVIIDLDNTISIIVSACVVVAYTLIGGLYSVAYTDVLQLFCIFIGLWLCIPYGLGHHAVKSFSMTKNDWFGSLENKDIGKYIDSYLLLILGGIPWQAYFQRVLSSKSAFKAQILSYSAAFGCFMMAIPPMIIGAIARVTTWNQTDLSVARIEEENSSLVLPLVLQYLTPSYISWIGLGAVSAAVMSSSDSSLLSASSMFARNVYKVIIRKRASEVEVILVMRCSILVISILATLMALSVKSIYDLWFLSSDLVYVILFPQLVCVVYFKTHCNTHGSLSAFFVGLILRLLAGEDSLGFPVIVKYPNFDPEDGQLFPFRTFSMLCSLITLLCVSKISQRYWKSSGEERIKIHEASKELNKGVINPAFLLYDEDIKRIYEKLLDELRQEIKRRRSKLVIVKYNEIAVRQRVQVLKI